MEKIQSGDTKENWLTEKIHQGKRDIFFQWFFRGIIRAQINQKVYDLWGCDEKDVEEIFDYEIAKSRLSSVCMP